MEALHQAMGRIPSGVFVVTVGRPGEAGAVGTLVSFVQQVAFEPLTLAVAVKKGRALAEALRVGGVFVLNVCHAGDKQVLRTFAKAAQQGPEAFAGVGHAASERGGTILTDACAYVECRVVQVVDVQADHDLYIAHAVAGALLGDATLKPMVHIRHDGSKY